MGRPRKSTGMAVAVRVRMEMRVRWVSIMVGWLVGC